MSQTDLNVANASGAAVRADINAHLDALASQSSGASAPTTTFPNQWWLDTSTNILKQRDNANTAWVNTASKAGTTWVPYLNGILLDAATDAKAWASITYDGSGVPTLDDNLNVSSIVDNGVGKVTLNWDTDFASVNYAPVGSVQTGSTSDATASRFVSFGTRSAGALQFLISNGANPEVYVDPANTHAITIVAFGDQ